MNMATMTKMKRERITKTGTVRNMKAKMVRNIEMTRMTITKETVTATASNLKTRREEEENEEEELKTESITKTPKKVMMKQRVLQRNLLFSTGISNLKTFS